jgi:hypothetical protein
MLLILPYDVCGACLPACHAACCAWVPVDKLQTLAYQSGMFSKAQALRRDGCAPAAMGVPDDLPTRMAYQQLHVLAGMAGKVRPIRPW